MRILVLSDSHGDAITLKYAIANEPTASAIIFLGDVLSDFQQMHMLTRTKKVAAVRGNCDSYTSNYPLSTTEVLGGKTVFCTHGYQEQVKFGLDTLKLKAQYIKADIALFGHTHVPYTEYCDGLYLLNPGSVRQNSCGIIDITDNGIMCFTKNIIT